MKKVGTIKKLNLLLIMAILFSNIFYVQVLFGADSISLNQSQVVIASDSDSFSVSFKNETGAAINNLRASVTRDNAIYAAVESLDKTSVEAGGSFTVHFTCNPPESAASTTKSITVQFYWDGSDYALPINVSVGALSSTQTPAPEQKPELKLTAPTTYTALKPGVAQKVKVDLKNITNYSAGLVEIYPKVNSNFVMKRTDGTAPFPIMSNATKTIELEIVPDKTLSAGNYTVSFDATYENNSKKTFTQTFDIMVKVEQPEEAAPKVVMSDFKVAPESITAGKGFTIDAILKNVGGSGASAATLVITDLGTNGITVGNSANNKYIGDIAKNGQSGVSFSFNAGKDMKTGSYPINFKVKYSWKDKDYEEVFTYYVTVNSATDSGNSTDRAELQVASITRPTQTYGVGENVPISLIIKNAGVKAAKNIKITAAPETGIVPETANIQIVNSLDPGAQKELKFSFSPTASTVSQNYNIGFTVEYETGQADEAETAKKTDSFMQYVGVSVSNPEADKKDEEDEDKNKSVPKLIISDYTIDPLIVMAGSIFDMDVTFQNTHVTKGVNNVKIVMKVLATETEKGDVFTPYETSNTFYIEKIGPKADMQHHIRFYVVPDAKAKNYNINVKMEYEDDEGNPFTAEEQVGVNVKQVAKLELGDINVPEQIYMGETVNLYFSVHNTGKVTLNNLKIKAEGKGLDTSVSEQIFGNFISGAYDNYDSDFYGVEPGATTVSVVVTYDDDVGEHVEEVHEFPITVMDAPMPQDPWGGGMAGDKSMMEPQPENTGVLGSLLGLLKSWYFWVGVGVVVVAAVTVTVVLVKRHKRKKEMNFNE